MIKQRRDTYRHHLEREVWLPVVGWEDRYMVSSHGRVWNLVKRRMLIATPHPKDGYFRVTLRMPGKEWTVRVHTLMLTAFDRPRPPGMVTRHLDGHGFHNDLVNMTWGTPRENNLDTVRHGRHRNGQRWRTACPAEHVLIAPNLRAAIARDGRRGCLACHRAQSCVATARMAGRSVPDVQVLADEKYELIMAGSGIMWRGRKL
jgi:hypothetical protein